MPKQKMPVDWITPALNILENVSAIADKAMLTPDERKVRFELKKVKKQARIALEADKLTYRRIKIRIDMALLGMDIAKKEGLKVDLLKANLQKLVEALSECRLSE